MTRCPEIGSIVEVRGQQWLLTHVQPFDACTVLSLEGRERGNALERMQVIEPFDRPRLATSTSLERRCRRRVLAHALAAIRSATPIDGLWTAATAQMDLHAYQLEPALAAIRGATRLLLADAVGLGKTIQAGLLLAELHHRGWIARGLIVCPAGMRETWQRELRDRFGLAATILDQQTLADRIAVFPPGVNPWTVDSIAIVSIDFIKRDEVMAALEGVPIDIVIADEAHHLSAGTDRGAAISRLASRAVWCVLVSATPHSGDRDGFDRLTRLGRHHDEIAIFRRTRSTIGLPNARRTRFLEIHLDAHERALLVAIAAYSRAIWIGRGRVDHAARLVAITLARRACSSSAAIERTLRRRHELLGSTPAEAAQPRLPWEDADEADAGDGDAIVGAQGLENVAEERTTLERLMVLVAACGSSSKMRRLMRLLGRIDEPVIVFTEYRDTLESIVKQLTGDHRVAAIHGGMSREQRTSTVDRFNSGGIDVLIATDAAGEGLNLHHRCRCVIDFELPWNPLRLEQRAGRVDRIGQRRIVHAIRFFHGATIEQDVLDRLELRRRRADDDLSRAVAEREVADAVFAGGELAASDAPNVRATETSSASSELGRLSQQRRTTAINSSSRYWALPRRGRSARLTALVRHTFVNAFGTVQGTHLEGLDLVFKHRPRSHAEWRAAIDSCSKPQNPTTSQPQCDRRRIAQRVRHIRALLAKAQRREYQRSLFDGRADSAQSARERDAARLDAALAGIDQAVAPPDPTRTRVEIVAAWPGRGA